MSRDEAAAWSKADVVEFFATHRRTTSEVYPSEWLFLKDELREGISILDLGCAHGGFAGVIAEHVKSFTYTGVDISPEMIRRGRARYPEHEFLCAPGGDYSLLEARRFDVVLALGFLHLHAGWRNTLAAAWSHTARTLITDLRETHLASIEDETVSSFRMDFAQRKASANVARVPYIILNTSDALEIVARTCDGASSLTRYGYMHDVSDAAEGPIRRVMATTYRVGR